MSHTRCRNVHTPLSYTIWSFCLFNLSNSLERDVLSQLFNWISVLSSVLKTGVPSVIALWRLKREVTGFVARRLRLDINCRVF